MFAIEDTVEIVKCGDDLNAISPWSRMHQLLEIIDLDCDYPLLICGPYDHDGRPQEFWRVKLNFDEVKKVAPESSYIIENIFAAGVEIQIKVE